MNSERTAYYDAEAEVYDETRGGLDRARAAADLVVSLVPPPGLLVDVAGGTGIVSAELAARGFDVVVTDLSPGMLALAGGRLPGRVVVAEADRLPLPGGSVDVVTMVWLLHLLPIPSADVVLAEAARVLRRGGHLVTTVDKDLAHGRVRRTGGDAADRVAAVLARHGLHFMAQEAFTGRSAWGSVAAGDPVFPVAAYRKR
ncbi:MAG TPA: methyltransferase domain-containing protein [Nocardioidaceae bacterium]|nr:methyltransferase domain-containing protein [Nocardioidaceae bacterium]